MRRCSGTVVIALLFALVCSANGLGSVKDRSLALRVRAADPSIYEPRMAKEWPNPRVMVDTEGVYVYPDARPESERRTSVEELGRELCALPRSRWRWGRVIALTLSPRMPVWKDGESREDDPRFATLVRVREILRSLDLVVVETPVGCGC